MITTAKRVVRRRYRDLDEQEIEDEVRCTWSCIHMVTDNVIENDVSRLELADGGHPPMQGICNITMFRLPC